ncbi:hypothetical protein [Kitasatospora kazusensis]
MRDNDQDWGKEIWGRFEECEGVAQVPAPYDWLTDESDRHGGTEYTRYRYDDTVDLHRFVSVYVVPKDLAYGGALIEVHASISNNIGDSHDQVIASGEMDSPRRLLPVLVSAIEAAESMNPADLDEPGRIRRPHARSAETG